MFYKTRCSNCGALNWESPTCRKCGKQQLVALEVIPDVLQRYPDLRKTERGFEAKPPPLRSF
jgi:hypothetical protein